MKTHRITKVPEEGKIIGSLLKLTISAFTEKVHKNIECRQILMRPYVQMGSECVCVIL